MKNTKIRQSSLPLLLSLLLTLAQPAGGAGSPGDGAEPTPDGQTANEAALTYYREGLVHKETAEALAASATSATKEAVRTQLLEEARAEYRAAAEIQGRALKLDLDNYQAANELGYALRKSGELRKALGAYNFALEIRPDFYPAIEYRGEAYLSLGMLDKAREAYLTLFRNDPALAARLLDAMAAAATGDAAFDDWVNERQRLAAVTRTAGAPTSDW